jgi:hypothetical protein
VWYCSRRIRPSRDPVVLSQIIFHKKTALKYF